MTIVTKKICMIIVMIHAGMEMMVIRTMMMRGIKGGNIIGVKLGIITVITTIVIVIVTIVITTTTTTMVRTNDHQG